MNLSRRHFLVSSSGFVTSTFLGTQALAQDALEIFNQYAERIVQRTLDRLQRHNSSHPLMLLIGETHNQLPHMIIQLLVFEKLQQEGIRFCAGLEFSHDHIFKAYSMHTHNNWQDWDRSDVDRIKSNDPNGEYALQSLILHQASVAPYAHRVIWNYLLENDIPSHVNDAAWARLDDYTRIDLRDPLTQEYVQEFLGDNIPTLPLTSRDGLLLRNHMMTDLASDFAQNKGVDLHVQLCGSGHITGTARPPRPFSDSLCALYDEKFIPFLAAPLVVEEEQYNIASDFIMASSEHIQDLVYPSERINNETLQMNRYLTNYGLEQYQIDIDVLRSSINDELSAIFTQWQQEQILHQAPSNDF